MKVKFITLMFLTFSFISYSQTEDFICGTIEDDSPDPEGVYSNSTDPSTLNNAEPLVLKVFFWGINRDDGSSDNKLTEADALYAVALLNIKYNPFNIFFKYTGYDFIDSTRFYTIYLNENDPNDTGESSSLYSFEEFVGTYPGSEYYEPAINFYIPKTTVGFRGGATSWKRIVINAGDFENEHNDRVINHEMGHILSLGHSHYFWNTSTEHCEHVTRDENDTDDPLDPNDTYFNANSKGDKVVDTAAVPDFINELCDELGYEPPYYEGCDAEIFFYINEEYCTYDNDEGRDCQETLFEIFTEDVRNLMAYTYASCGLDLTIGQGIRAREYIETNTFNYAITTVESLYKPYKGEYFIAGPQTIEHPPLFQPGFEYRFVECECDCDIPSDYNDTSFSYNINNVLLPIDKEETTYTNITHPNHSAIWIKHEFFGNQVFPQPRRCYDNWNKASIGGSITKFNDEVFNTNVTITVQDSTSINNQNLIENLESGLYKIDKIYEDGSTQETVIFKENN